MISYDAQKQLDMMDQHAEYDDWLTAKIAESGVYKLIEKDLIFFKEKLELVNIRYDCNKLRICSIMKQSDIKDTELEHLIKLLSVGLEVEYNKETSNLNQQIEFLQQTLDVYSFNKSLV